MLVVLLTVGGTITSAVLGWLDSGEAFNGRKFASSILHSILAGFVTSIGFSTVSTFTLWGALSAYLAGAGIDVLANRIEGMTAKKVTPLTSATQPSPM